MPIHCTSTPTDHHDQDADNDENEEDKPINNSSECNIVNISGSTRNNETDDNGDDEIAEEGRVYQSNPGESNSFPRTTNDANNSLSNSNGNHRSSSKKKREAIAV